MMPPGGDSRQVPRHGTTPTAKKYGFGKLTSQIIIGDPNKTWNQDNPH